MSNQSDHSWAISQVEEYIAGHDISEAISTFDSEDVFDLADHLNESHPIYDFWAKSAWHWLAKDELENLIKNNGKSIHRPYKRK